MISASTVTVVVNGAIVSGSAPARVVAGRVVTPLGPIVVSLASRVQYAPDARTVTIDHAGRRIVVPIVFVEDAIPYVAVGPIVAAMGGSAIFDSPSKTLLVTLPESGVITPAPLVGVPAAGETPSTRLSPAPFVTPRAGETPLPRPRRTAIPVTPSEPVPAVSPTDQRRSGF
jgi:hypothetical protein